jgi:predicted alpha/beta-hydrolase family hydrolase
MASTSSPHAGAPAEDFRIDLSSGASVGARWYPGAGETTLLLAHGAGAGHGHPFMTMAGRELSGRGLDVVTFNFPYMEARRKVPDAAAVLEAAYLDVIAAVRSRRVLAAAPLVIGGKSMGGRMASHVAAHHADRAGELAGLVFLGYPLHPPGRPTQRRDAHLPAIRQRMLFIQGSRDTFGTPAELRPVLDSLAAPAELFEVEGGDHSFAVPKKGPVTQAEVYTRLFDRIVDWVHSASRSRRA